MSARDLILSGLNDEQRAAVLHDGGPLLILAGAGSGKTKTATARVARLIIDGTPPERICVLTFTNKAAGEIRERIAAVCGPAARRVTAGTFHSVAARLLRERPQSIGLKDGFTIYDDDDSRALLKSLVRSVENADRDDVKNAYALISGARDRGILPVEFAAQKKIEDTPECALAVRHYPEYVRKLADANAVDFAGLLLHLRALCAEHPAIYSTRWDHIIVDEYQDTNAVQDSIVTAFAFKHRNICAVGDEQQSIYGFRGAQIDNILSFKQRWGADAQVIALEANYRSAPEILAPANAILRHAEGGYGKRLRAHRYAGGKVVAWVAEDEYDEARRIVRKCVDLHGKGTLYAQQAIIYRTNAQSRVLEQEFNRASVPYRIVGGVSFWDRAEIKDCLAYLRLIHNRNDDVAFRRVYNTPRRGLGDSALKLIELAQNPSPDDDADPMSMLSMIFGEVPEPDDPQGSVAGLDDMPQEPVYGPSLSLWDASDKARLKGAALTGLRRFRAAIEGAAAYSGDLCKALSSVLAAVNYPAHLEAEKETAQDKAANIEQLQDLCSGYSDLSEFLEYAALSADAAQDKGGDRVTLCTMHGSKGLEWNIVYACGWERSLFPSPRALAEGTLAEERRLAYVCITRARDMLFIGGARKRRGSEAHPSPLLREAGLVIMGWGDDL